MLATAADVRRLLGQELNDEEIEPVLTSVETWVQSVANRDWESSGAVQETFPSASEGDVLALKDETPTGVKVTVFLAPDSAGRVLVSAEFSVGVRGRVRIVHNPYRTRPVIQEHPQYRQRGLGQALLTPDAQPPVNFDRVVVDYTATGTVPTPVREAVALITAASIAQARSDVSGMQSEKLGDYSYTRVAGKDIGIAVPARAIALLRPYIGRGVGGGLWPTSPVAEGQVVF